MKNKRGLESKVKKLLLILATGAMVCAGTLGFSNRAYNKESEKTDINSNIVEYLEVYKSKLTLQDTRTIDNVKYSMKTDKEIYDNEEKIEVNYTWENISEEPIKFFFYQNTECGFFAEKDNKELNDKVVWVSNSLNQAIEEAYKPETRNHTYYLNPAEIKEHTETWQGTSAPGIYNIYGFLIEPYIGEPAKHYIPILGRSIEILKPEPIIGDINQDREIDAVDLQYIINTALKLFPYNPLSDINNDGNIDAVDIQSEINLILRV